MLPSWNPPPGLLQLAGLILPGAEQIFCLSEARSKSTSLGFSYFISLNMTSSWGANGSSARDVGSREKLKVTGIIMGFDAPIRGPVSFRNFYTCCLWTLVGGWDLKENTERGITSIPNTLSIHSRQILVRLLLFLPSLICLLNIALIYSRCGFSTLEPEQKPWDCISRYWLIFGFLPLYLPGPTECL